MDRIIRQAEVSFSLRTVRDKESVVADFRVYVIERSIDFVVCVCLADLSGSGLGVYAKTESQTKAEKCQLDAVAIAVTRCLSSYDLEPRPSQIAGLAKELQKALIPAPQDSPL